MGIGSIITLVLGIALVYWINRRKFNRRNMAGVEEFESFEQATFVRLAEAAGRIFGIILIIGSLFYGCLMKPSMEKARERMEARKSQNQQQ